MALHVPGRTSSTWATVDQRHQNQVHLYTSLGYPNTSCGTVIIDGLADVLFLGWNEAQDHLIVVLQSGEIRFFSLRGETAAPTVYIDLIPGHIIQTANGVAGLCRSNGQWNVVLVSYVEARGGSYDISMLEVSHLTRAGGTFHLLEASPGVTVDDHANADCTSLFLFYSSTEKTSGVGYCCFPANSATSPTAPTFRDLNVSLDGVISRVTLSPEGEHIAYTTVSGDVFVTTTAFEELLLVHNSRKPGGPSSAVMPYYPRIGARYPFLFCGPDALLISSAVHPDDGVEEEVDGEVDECVRYLLVSTDGLEEAIDLSVDIPESGVVCVAECDGVRMLSDSSLFFLQVVPQEAVRVFGVGSLAPGAVLRSAYEEFVAGNASAIHILHQLQLNPQGLMEGIEDCIRTATFEWNVQQQQKLLRIATFGKSFCSAYDPDLFVTVAKELRVRNTWRVGPSKMVVSHLELEAWGALRMMRRLVRGGQHHAAWVMCDALRCWNDEIRSEWVLSKLVQDMKHEGKSEEEAARELVQFLKNAVHSSLVESGGGGGGGRSRSEISFTELANVARIHGKTRAAVVFLEGEEVAVRQVPMLLVFGEPEKALEKAIAASDGDLVFTVIQYLIRAGGGAREMNLITSHSEARKLLYLYVFACPHYLYCLKDHLQSHPAVEQFFEIQNYLREQKRLRKALMERDGKGGTGEDGRGEEPGRGCPPPHHRHSSTPGPSARLSIPALCTKYQQPKKDIARRLAGMGSTPGGGGVVQQGGGTTQTERYMAMQAGIVEKQSKWAVQFNDERFLTASVADMVRLLLEHGGSEAVGHVASLRADYAIPDDMYHWCQAKVFAEKGQWDMLDQMGGIHPSKRLRPVLSGVALVTLLLSYNRPQQAAKHIPRIPKIEERLEYYVHCGEWGAAGADCAKTGNTDLFAQLKGRGKGSAAVQEQIQRGWDAAAGSSGLSFGMLFSSS